MLRIMVALSTLLLAGVGHAETQRVEDLDFQRILVHQRPVSVQDLQLGHFYGLLKIKDLSPFRKNDEDHEKQRKSQNKKVK